MIVVRLIERNPFFSGLLLWVIEAKLTNVNADFAPKLTDGGAALMSSVLSNGKLILRFLVSSGLKIVRCFFFRGPLLLVCH
jgi:hypothetical protein